MKKIKKNSLSRPLLQRIEKVLPAKKIIGKFAHKQADIIKAIKHNPATALVIGVISILVALGNPFLAGAILGGGIAAEKAGEMQHAVLNEMPVIVATMIGAIGGGLLVLCAVVTGSFTNPVGLVVGAALGIVLTVLFARKFTAKLVGSVMDAPAVVLVRKIKHKY